MGRSSDHKTRKRLLVTAISSALLFTATSTNAWWRPGVPYAWGWDPNEAYLNEYGFLDRHGPTIGDIRRMHRDNWKEMRGYPVYRSGVSLYGPRPSDVRRQHQRKARRLWGYY